MNNSFRGLVSAPAPEAALELRDRRLVANLDLEWLPVDALRPADSPRRAGEDMNHVEMLASIEDHLPPIVVHRDSMRVIDGMHRLRAAKLRGDDMIEVSFFDGTEQEAFVLAVTANTTHGLPLTLGDRTLATERILASQPTWSDRAIAMTVGLGARTVGNIRRRMQDEAAVERVSARTGRDGRVRPLDNNVGRLRASALIKQRPEASLREIAREVGVSPSTVRDVRQRLERGEDPLPQMRRRREKPVDREAVSLMLQGLQNDPSLRFTESGRTVLRWIHSRAIRAEEWSAVEHKVPAHCAYILASVARSCADEWLQIADELEQRSTRPA
ncbi:ParB N-terminal domain-containing protein [Plantactinospora sp. S1510]|uniref:ParB N-terminal domain-containing protein n=1 Tax=Plantactinospora alkalitolerans TaxID=2789879 RepID=A0ABS0GZA1_9ACTN|nr:helix-turn-helix domain-containing protein [Plantactinospora alkalitolerans]MBF9131539.1 ParB N-terminal domain-containing protein [Plantactinospora alkalitolerans]